jgi:hypothetical protein
MNEVAELSLGRTRVDSEVAGFGLLCDLTRRYQLYLQNYRNHWPRISPDTKLTDVDAMIGPFAEGAIVKDEGQERRGLPAIRKWMDETTAKSSAIAPVEI